MQRTSFFTSLFLIAILAATAQICSAQSQGASFSLLPAAGSYESGNMLEAEIKLDTAGQNIDGVDVYLLYPADLLEVQDADDKTAGIQLQNEKLLPNTQSNYAYNEQGKIDFSQVSSPGQYYKGSGTLAKIKFKVMGPGTAKLDFDSKNCNIASKGKDILVKTNGAEFALTGEQLKTAKPVEAQETTSAKAPAEEVAGINWQLTAVLIGLILALFIVWLLMRSRRLKS